MGDVVMHCVLIVAMATILPTLAMLVLVPWGASMHVYVHVLYIHIVCSNGWFLFLDGLIIDLD